MAVHLSGAPNGSVSALPERFERKYYLPPRDVGLAYGLLRHTCLADRFYARGQVNSLYFDTAELEQHERSDSGDYFKDKVRIRWYGERWDSSPIQVVFLELKSRRGFVGTKQRRRIQVPAVQLAPENLGRGIVPTTLLAETLALFGRFPAGKLLPVVAISYWRYRFCEIATGQRVSLDCHIRSTALLPGMGHGETQLELPGAIVEIKGRTMELPATLRSARMLQMDWARFSKYSACLDAHMEQPGMFGRLSPSGRAVR